MKSTESAEEEKQSTVTLAPNPENRCFGCGGANDGGMKLTFVQDNEKRRIEVKSINRLDHLRLKSSF